MVEQVLSVLSVLAMGALKFLFAAPLSYGLGFSFLGTLALLLVGGGIVVHTPGDKRIKHGWAPVGHRRTWHRSERASKPMA